MKSTIAAAISSEPRSDFICVADLFHTQCGFHCICHKQMLFMHFFSIEFRARIFILMDIMIFHIIIQKIISLVFIIGFPFSLIFISHFQNPIIFINDFSSSISHENSILNTSHFSFQLIFINDFFHPISIHKNAHFSLIFQAFSSIFINSFGITIEIFSLVFTSEFCTAFSKKKA